MTSKRKLKKIVRKQIKQNNNTNELGDVIAISITDIEDIDGSYTVSPQGDVTIPYVGQVLILDKTKEEAQQFINEVLKNFYKEPETIVKVEQYNSSLCLYYWSNKSSFINFTFRTTIKNIRCSNKSWIYKRSKKLC